MKNLTVHYLPQFVSESNLAGGTVVVIDLLRASTTICHALAAGAEGVGAFREVGDAVRAAEARGDRASLLLGGERGGERIAGFDLGNSPAEYTPDQVFGKEVFFTTTNGTLALQHARLASRVLVGAAANLSAMVDILENEDHVHLLCAGTNGRVSREDQLIAGALTHALATRETNRRNRNESADSVAREWQELLGTARALGRSTSEQLAIELCDTLGGKNLIAIGMESDLPLCAKIDTHDLVPEYDTMTGRITVC